MTLFRRLQSARVFFLVVAIVNIGLLTWWWLSAYEISNESGPLENLQAAILLLVFAIYCFNGMKSEGAGRTIAVMSCFLCFTMFFREVDFETFTDSELVLSITRGRTQIMIFWLSLFLLGGYIIAHFTHFRTMVAGLLHWRAWPYYMWFVLMILGELAEEVSQVKGNTFGDFVIPHGQFWEEMLEFNAYMALLFASITFFAFNRFLCERAGNCAKSISGSRSASCRPA